MFQKARIKLTAWYLLIIMLVSIVFSLVIYSGIDRELKRFEGLQNMRLRREQELMLPAPLPPELHALDAQAITDGTHEIDINPCNYQYWNFWNFRISGIFFGRKNVASY